MNFGNWEFRDQQAGVGMVSGSVSIGHSTQGEHFMKNTSKSPFLVSGLNPPESLHSQHTQPDGSEKDDKATLYSHKKYPMGVRKASESA